MTEQEKRQLLLRRASLLQQIHATVIFEKEMLKTVSLKQLQTLRDAILDELIEGDKRLGIRKQKECTMQKEKKLKLDELMITFGSMYTEQERLKFQALWEPFYMSLSEIDKKVAINAWMNCMHDNAKKFKEEAIVYSENATLEDRQSVSELLNSVKEHPFFVREAMPV